MSGFLFLIDIDWVMSRTLENNRNRIRLKLTTALDDLDFADDFARHQAGLPLMTRSVLTRILPL